MIIEKFIVPGGDNYNYIIASKKTGEAVVIDPIAIDKLLEIIEKRSYKIKYILNTHSHGDHTAGNQDLKKETGAPILTYKGSSGADEFIKNGDIINIGTLKIKAIYTPGHTFDSVCFLVEDKLFCGDTVFLSGAGNCWSGNPEMLYESFAKILVVFPGDTELHVGHEYAHNNLEFAKSIEPANEVIDKKLQEVRTRKMNLSTVGEEKQYNPFFRFNNKEYYQNLKKKVPNLIEDPKNIFLKTRELRNKW